MISPRPAGYGRSPTRPLLCFPKGSSARPRCCCCPSCLKAAQAHRAAGLLQSGFVACPFARPFPTGTRTPTALLEPLIGRAPRAGGWPSCPQDPLAAVRLARIPSKQQQQGKQALTPITSTRRSRGAFIPSGRSIQPTPPLTHPSHSATHVHRHTASRAHAFGHVAPPVNHRGTGARQRSSSSSKRAPAAPS